MRHLGADPVKRKAILLHMHGKDGSAAENEHNAPCFPTAR